MLEQFRVLMVDIQVGLKLLNPFNSAEFLDRSSQFDSSIDAAGDNLGQSVDAEEGLLNFLFDACLLCELEGFFPLRGGGAGRLRGRR